MESGEIIGINYRNQENKIMAKVIRVRYETVYKAYQVVNEVTF